VTFWLVGATAAKVAADRAKISPKSNNLRRFTGCFFHWFPVGCDHETPGWLRPWNTRLVATMKHQINASPAHVKTKTFAHCAMPSANRHLWRNAYHCCEAIKFCHFEWGCSVSNRLCGHHRKNAFNWGFNLSQIRGGARFPGTCLRDQLETTQSFCFVTANGCVQFFTYHEESLLTAGKRG